MPTMATEDSAPLEQAVRCDKVLSIVKVRGIAAKMSLEAQKKGLQSMLSKHPQTAVNLLINWNFNMDLADPEARLQLVQGLETLPAFTEFLNKEAVTALSDRFSAMAPESIFSLPNQQLGE